MIEIRPIQTTESAAFLTLLCKVFHLDEQRAHSVFYSEPFFDLTRKWALFDSGKMVSILTTTPLSFGWGNAIGIAGVATDESRRRCGLSQKLLEAVLSQAAADSEGPALLFAHQTELYQRVGFEHLDDVVRGKLITESGQAEKEPLPLPRVREIYDRWAEGHKDRIIRNDQRWDYWNWVMRTCEPVGDGYICQEPNMVREAVDIGDRTEWPACPAAEWVGLRSMIPILQVPVKNPKPELMLMGRGFTTPPQMFMTDQF